MIGRSPMYKDQEVTRLLEQSISAALVHGNWQQSLEWLEQLQNLVPLDNRIIVLQARALCNLREFTKAKLKLSELPSNKFVSSSYYHCLGEISVSTGNYIEGIDYFSDAIKSNFGSFIDQSICQNYTGRAAALSMVASTKSAQTDLKMVELLSPLRTARKLYLAGRPAHARQCLEKLPDWLQSKTYVAMTIARCHLAEHNYQKAFALTRKMQIAAKSCNSALYYRALASFFNKHLIDCISDLSDLIDSNCGILAVESLAQGGGFKVCDDIDARFLRARASMALGKIAESLPDLDYVLLRRPTWQAYVERSRAAYQLTLFDTALGDAQAAHDMNPSHFGSQNQLRECLLKIDANGV